MSRGTVGIGEFSSQRIIAQEVANACAAWLMAKHEGDPEPLVYNVMTSASGDPAEAFVMSNEWSVLRQSSQGDFTNQSASEKIAVFKKLIPEFRPPDDAGGSRRVTRAAKIPAAEEPCNMELLRTWAGALERALKERTSTLLSLRPSGNTNAALAANQYTCYQTFLDCLGTTAIHVRDEIDQSSSTWLGEHINAVEERFSPISSIPSEALLIPMLIDELTRLGGLKLQREKRSICLDLNSSIMSASALCNKARHGDRLKQLKEFGKNLRESVKTLTDEEVAVRMGIESLFGESDASPFCRSRLERLSMDELRDLRTTLTSGGRQPSWRELETNLRSFEELPEKPARKVRQTANDKDSSKAVYLSLEEIERRRREEHQRDLSFAQRYLSQMSNAMGTSSSKQNRQEPTQISKEAVRPGVSAPLSHSRIAASSYRSTNDDEGRQKEPTLQELAEKQRARERWYGRSWRMKQAREASLEVGRGSNLVFRTLHGLTVYPKDPNLVDSSVSKPQWSAVDTEGTRLPLETIIREEQQAELERRLAALTAVRALRRKKRAQASSRSSKMARPQGPTSGTKKNDRSKSGKADSGRRPSGSKKSKRGAGAAPSTAYEEPDTTDLAVDAAIFDEDGEVKSFGKYAWCLQSFDDDHHRLSYNSLENDELLRSWGEDSGPFRPRRRSISLPVGELDEQDLVSIEQLLS